VAACRARLRDARMALLQARVATDAQRPAFVERARTTLSQTTAVQTADGSVIVLDDSRVARRLATTTAAIDASVADVDQLIAIADRAASPPFNVTQANAKLRDFAVAEETRSGSNDLFPAIGALLARLFPSAGPQLPPGSVELTLTIAGIGLLVVILAILVQIGRASCRERGPRS